MAEQVYYGESPCTATVKSSGQACRNKAYYLVGGLVVCGVHGKGSDRVELPKRPAAEKALIKSENISSHLQTVEAAAQANAAAGRRGDVILIKFENRRAVKFVPGYLNVFPNNKHQDRPEGFGCASLSPMRLGPVVHGQPDLPEAKNLENFHQGNKCFPQEADESGNPTLAFVENRLKMYCDPEPHRHKFSRGDRPLYSVWTDKTGTSYKIDYLSSRQFYCNFYERLAKVQNDYLQLGEWLDEGYNLAIQGYDAFHMGLSPDEIEATYLNPAQPFGHERCLVAMLVLQEEEYPWRTYKDFDF